MLKQCLRLTGIYIAALAVFAVTSQALSDEPVIVPSFARAIESPSTTWTVIPKSTEVKAPASIIDPDHGPGKRITVDLENASDRSTIRLKGFNIDLKDINYAGCWISVSNPEPIDYITFYAFSKHGVFKRSIRDFGSKEDPWRSLGIDVFHAKNHSYIEGKPLWKEGIQAINITLWKSKNITSVKNWKTTITIAGFQADKRSDKPLIFTLPKAVQALAKPVKRNAKGQLLETRPILASTALWWSEGADKTLDKIKNAGFNVFVPCVWLGIGPIYRSPYEPKIDYRFAKFFANGKDPLRELIKKAHARGIEVLGWFDVAKNADGFGNKFHPEFKEPGTPANFFDMQNPAFRDYIVREIVTFAKNYPVDGILLDYIRTGGISFSKTAAKEYRKKYHADLNELRNNAWMTNKKLNHRFFEWQAAAVSNVVRRVSEGIRAIRPNMIIATAGIPLPKLQMSVQGRNEWIWLEKGWIDVAYNMDYGNPSVRLLATRRSLPAYADRFAEMLATYSRSPNAKDKLPGTGIVFGMRTGSKNGQTYANSVEYSLRMYPGPGGVATYWYENLNTEIANALRAGPFKENALPAWHEQYLPAVLLPH